jgi:hypothetical protein
MLNDKENNIARPRQVYVVYGERPYKRRNRMLFCARASPCGRRLVRA